MPTAKKESFTLATAQCRTSGNTSRLNDEKAIALAPVESRVGMESCLPTTGPVRCFGVAEVALGKKKKANDACTRKVKSRYLSLIHI